MRKFAFYLLFGILILGVADLIWPLWDFREGVFVTQLLSHMKPDEAGSVSAQAWIGPGVETEATALVAGALEASRPINVTPADSLTGEFRGYPSECIFVFQEMKGFYGWLYGGPLGWVFHRHTRVWLAGKGLHIGAWAVDRDYFPGALVPHKILADDLPCPGRDKALCHIAETCVPGGEYSILGNRESNSTGALRVSLPNPTLVDYPLLQPGFQTPPEFAKSYAARMIERVDTWPITAAMIQLVVGGLLLFISRREIKFPARRDVEGWCSWLVTSIASSNRSGLDFATMGLVVAVPFLPILAYQHITDGEAVTLYTEMSLGGLLAQLYLLLRRMDTEPSKLPVREGDIAL